MDTKKTTPNIDVFPENLGAMLEYWYIDCHVAYYANLVPGPSLDKNSMKSTPPVKQYSQERCTVDAVENEENIVESCSLYLYIRPTI